MSTDRLKNNDTRNNNVIFNNKTRKHINPTIKKGLI